MRPTMAAAWLLLAAATGLAAPQDEPTPAPVTPEDSLVTIVDGEAVLAPVGTIEHAEIDESSGLVVLGTQWFTHNDSGDTARLFQAASPNFEDAEPLALPGAAAVDWETLTVLEGDLLACDVGDNLRSRSDVTLYRARYVPADDVAPTPARLELVATYPVAYPDGAHDCEAAFVLDGKLHLVVKNRGEPTTDVFRFEALEDIRKLPTGKRNVGVKVGSLELPAGEQVTDAAIHAASGKLVLLTYSQLLVFAKGQVAGAPERAVTLHAQQCEALAFHGDDLYMTNEQREVYRFARFLDREVEWALPQLPSYEVSVLPATGHGLDDDGFPGAATPLTSVHLKHAANDDTLRVGVTGERLLIEGNFACADTPTATRQDSPRLGTCLLMVLPRERSLSFGPEDVQIAAILREDYTVTVLRMQIQDGRSRPELVPQARVRGQVEDSRFEFVLSLPLEYALGDPAPETFRFNAIGIRLTKGPAPIVSGANIFSLIRPFMAASIRRVPAADGGKDE